MVTKQQQLELIAKECHTWKGRDFILVSDTELGYRLPVTAGCHLITREEWQQERDKMQNQNDNTRELADSAKEIEKIDLQINVYGSKQDNSWHERGELPPVGVTCLSPGGETIMIASHGSISNVPVAFYPFGVSGLYSAACAKQFRPLRTEREKAIDEMATLAMDCKKYDITQNVAKAVCELLYDAGYRKQ